MSKRKLSRQQKWRIEKIQQERAERAGRRAAKAEASLLESEQLGPEEQALVIAHFGTQLEVEALSGEFIGQVLRCHVRANVPALVTGDKVVWCSAGNSMGVIVALIERQNLLSRPDKYNNLKPVAANIDVIIITIAPEPEPMAILIDRYLVAAESSQIQAIILLNKVDLMTAENQQKIESLLSVYPQIGYEVIEASSRTEADLNKLQSFLADKTCVFVGQSGVGKSSLVNALLPDADLVVNILSEANQKGQHTTTTARLFHFPDGGQLIDSPGIREFGLWHIDKQSLLEGFREFQPFLGRCKYRDCQHQQEPGCALRQALADGDISEQRMQSYWRIEAELGQW